MILIYLNLEHKNINNIFIKCYLFIFIFISHVILIITIVFVYNINYFYSILSKFIKYDYNNINKIILQIFYNIPSYFMIHIFQLLTNMILIH